MIWTQHHTAHAVELGAHPTPVRICLLGGVHFVPQLAGRSNAASHRHTLYTIYIAFAVRRCELLPEVPSSAANPGEVVQYLALINAFWETRPKMLRMARLHSLLPAHKSHAQRKTLALHAKPAVILASTAAGLPVHSL